MFTLPPAVRINLAPGATDLRLSFNGLECAAREVLGKDPLTGRLFVFCNRRRTRLIAALLDRLLHRCHVMNIKGRSYRLRDLERLLKQ
jgi:transposase